jgi:hypothetical protein
MTPGNGLSWDDLDELADYAEGVLTGSSATRVAELIRTDERWAAAHAALAAAEPLVRAALQAAAETPASLPDDVAARLDAMPLEPVRDRSSASLQRHPAPSGRPVPAGPPRPRAGTRPAGRSRRPVLTRVLAGVLVLVAVGGFAAVARQFLVGGALDSSAPAEDVHAESGGDRGAAPDAGTTVPPMAATPAAAGDLLAGAKLFNSGTDYRADTLAQLADQPVPFPAPTLSERADAFADGDLSALSAPDRLHECLTAVGQVYPGAVVAADFARFEGQPAMILVIRRSDTSTVVAVGPECGATGADVLASIDVP